MQSSFDTRRGKIPVKKDDAIILASLDLFSVFGPYKPSYEPKMREIYKHLIPSNVVGQSTND
jgi:hypothetical protein